MSLHYNTNQISNNLNKILKVELSRGYLDNSPLFINLAHCEDLNDAMATVVDNYPDLIEMGYTISRIVEMGVEDIIA